MLTILKFLEGPGSLRLFVLLAGIGFAVRHWSRQQPLRRAATIALVGLTLSYAVLALPITAHLLLDRLAAPQPATEAEVAHVTVLFIFDGDNRRGRARQAAFVAKHAQVNEAWLLGARYLLDDLMFENFPPALLRRDDSSTNTQAQILQAGRIAGKPGAHAGIVASRISMPRIARFARSTGLEATLIAAPLDEEPARQGFWSFVPSYGALKASRDAIYELAALWYYRERTR